VEVGPDALVEDVALQAADHRLRPVDHDRLLEERIDLGDEDRQRGGVVGVGVAHEDVADAELFIGCEPDADAAAVERDLPVDQEGGEGLQPERLAAVRGQEPD
jgi:hypothetical protein